ncbi:hypothetical protein LTR37_016513 [Vermiconidia calcicola]|uniref:Uncharacterized protein n=1 Tax=Vermiconidia calcicola TaxID=1690605 RepID=A0ACC3MNS1_9PEZI|nr:hypothetical protein LTR37_016513 [Vermiconidia calcicola]
MLERPVYAEFMITFPPSPSLSACDSLADIDDLDAFLEAQGRLSHWPTPPPPKDEATVTEIELDCDELDDESLDYSYIARTFAHQAISEVAQSESNISLVEGVILRARLPPEVLALAFNILVRLNRCSLPTDSLHSTPVDLLVVSTLSLAASYTHDHPPSLLHWSRYVCGRAWTTARIDETNLLVMSLLDWRLHESSSAGALDDAMARLTAAAAHASSSPVYNDERPHLKVVIDGPRTCWIHGQIMPEGTPLPSAFGAARHQFLPLL